MDVNTVSLEHPEVARQAILLAAKQYRWVYVNNSYDSYLSPGLRWYEACLCLRFSPVVLSGTV